MLLLDLWCSNLQWQTTQKTDACVAVLRFVDSMVSVVSIGLFIVKDDGEMVACDTCDHYEHLACRGHLCKPEGDHKCHFCCTDPSGDLTVYFFNVMCQFYFLHP